VKETGRKVLIRCLKTVRVNSNALFQNGKLAKKNCFGDFNLKTISGATCQSSFYRNEVR